MVWYISVCLFSAYRIFDLDGCIVACLEELEEDGKHGLLREEDRTISSSNSRLDWLLKMHTSLGRNLYFIENMYMQAGIIH